MWQLTPSLRVEDRGDGRGRAVYAATPVAAGAEVLVADAFATVVVDGWMRHVCAACFAFDCRRRFKVACDGGCRTAVYCSEGCRERHRSEHALECALLTRLQGRIAKIDPDYNHPHFKTRLRLLVALFARVMVLLEQAGTPPPPASLPAAVAVALAKTSAVTAPSPSMADLLALATNYHEYTNDEALMTIFVTSYEILRSVVPQAVLGDVIEYVKLLCREECNSFGFWDEGDEMYAYGLFPRAAFFNHSCCPTVCKYTRGRRVHFRAMRDLAPGEELTISYVLLNDSTEMRQRIVRASYLFKCTCARCVAAPNAPDPFLSEYVHQCGGPIYPDPASGTRVCSKCNAVVAPPPCTEDALP